MKTRMVRCDECDKLLMEFGSEAEAKSNQAAYERPCGAQLCESCCDQCYRENPGCALWEEGLLNKETEGTK